MTNRFKYEPPSSLRKIRAKILHPKRWREIAAPWVQDLEGGTRFQLRPDEEETIHRLNVRIPGKNEWPAAVVTLDELASAAFQRRLGYVFEWDRIARIETPGSDRKRRNGH